ncbi:uncharacterized protein LOC134814009 [Bolinopsis microptera]|uniref:uncharacterized protein LOC134814009 n=1 Tax=Bolinopsis microptera TaxID=2820187 RepID=UPI003079F41D
MEVQISRTLNKGVLTRMATEEDHIAEKKFYSPSLSTPIVSQDLFSSCVPYKSPDNIVNNLEEEEEEEEGDCVKDQESHSSVPTLEADEDEMEITDLETSVLKSPETPEPNMFVNEDSMGFDNLNALNIVTPSVDSTQSFMSLLKKNLSPIKRKCLRVELEPEPLNSTQTYFNLTKHYKLLSEERKKVLYGKTCDKSNSTTVRPLRRKLFNEKEGEKEEVLERREEKEEEVVEATELGDYDYKLESFEEEWAKVSVLKPNSAVRVKSTAKTDGVSATNRESGDKSNGPFNVANSLKTPNKQIVKLQGETPLDICDIDVPSMVVEETVCTVEDTVYLVEEREGGTVSSVSTDCKPAETVDFTSFQEIVSDEKLEPVSCALQSVDNVIVTDLTSNATTIKSVQTNEAIVSSPAKENVATDEHSHSDNVVTMLPECLEVEKVSDYFYQDKKMKSEDCPEKKLSAVAGLNNQLSCKRPLVHKQTFDPENRIYKRARAESGADRGDEGIPINSPELVQKMFRETGLLASGFPSYPPPISKIVPIPIPDAPVTKRRGLTRRSTRLSLHPYIIRNIHVNEE